MDIGLKLGSFSSLDSGVSVSAASEANGSSKDLTATDPRAARVRARFAASNSGTTDKTSLDVGVQFSEDNSTWPDNTERDIVFAWDANALGLSAGADLTKSNPVSFVPKARYFRFRIHNYDGTDAISFSSEVALDYGTTT
jgi:hypothetical protein